MCVSYLVFYHGSTSDPVAFINYYKTRHAQLLLKFPGLIDLRIHESLDWSDAQNISKGSFLLIAEMSFPDVETMETAISSPERKIAREDFDKFPLFEGTVWHQAMTTTIGPKGFLGESALASNLRSQYESPNEPK